MRQIRPGVYINDPLPAHTTNVSNDWCLKLELGIDFPLPTAIIINGQYYIKKESRETNQHSGA